MNEWRRASESMWLSPVRTSALFQTPTASAQGSKMSQSFRWWRGAKWQSGVQRVLPFPIQVFKTWSLITPLSCCTVNILPRRTADMTFTIPFTSIYTARSLLLGFFTFASKKSSSPWQPGSIYEKSPCFHPALFGTAAFHTFTQGFKTEASHDDKDWSNLKAVNEAWVMLRRVLGEFWLKALASK